MIHNAGGGGLMCRNRYQAPDTMSQGFGTRDQVPGIKHQDHRQGHIEESKVCIVDH